MANFEYKDPYIYRPEDNKKWCVRYSVRYAGEKNFKPMIEYGRNYFGYSLNSKNHLKNREQNFNDLLVLVRKDLKDGIIIKEPETIKKAIEKEVEAAKKYSYDECFNLYLTLKGYVNPIPKKVMSAKVFTAFHKNQFRPFLEKKSLLDDITQITKSHLQEFMNFYYLNSDPDIKWSNNTFNNKKGFISTFFETMVDEEIIKENPVTRIKTKESESTERFELFTKEERDLIFAYFDKTDVFMATIVRLIYFAYIRETELTRLNVDDFDLDRRQIRIRPDNAKGQRDKLVRWVKINVPLKEALERYLNTFEHQPRWYMFAKKYRPSEFKLGNHWQYLFRDCLADLRKEHPKLFSREGLSLYGLKHSGVTDFVNDNASKYTSTELFRYLQSQLRHETFEMTQRYLKKLEINMELVDGLEFI